MRVGDQTTLALAFASATTVLRFMTNRGYCFQVLCPVLCQIVTAKYAEPAAYANNYVIVGIISSFSVISFTCKICYLELIAEICTRFVKKTDRRT